MAQPFDTINHIEIYEINGEDVKGLKSKTPKIFISNHWNNKAFINIEIEGKKITVLADQVKRAIDNSQNSHQ